MKVPNTKMPAENTMPSDPNMPAEPEMPDDIATARQLWWAIIGLGLARMVVLIIDLIGQRREFTDQLVEQMRSSNPEVTPEMIESMMPVVFVVFGVIGVVAAIVGAVVVHQLARGKLWARVLLTFVGVWLIFMAISSMFSLDAITGPASLIGGGATIVQGVLAAGAIYLCHRPDSVRYFQPPR